MSDVFFPQLRHTISTQHKLTFAKKSIVSQFLALPAMAGNREDSISFYHKVQNTRKSCAVAVCLCPIFGREGVAASTKSLPLYWNYTWGYTCVFRRRLCLLAQSEPWGTSLWTPDNMPSPYTVEPRHLEAIYTAPHSGFCRSPPVCHSASLPRAAKASACLLRNRQTRTQGGSVPLPGTDSRLAWGPDGAQWQLAWVADKRGRGGSRAMPGSAANARRVFEEDAARCQHVFWIRSRAAVHVRKQTGWVWNALGCLWSPGKLRC